MRHEIDIQKSKANRRLQRKISLIEIVPKYFLLTTWLFAFPTILGSMYFNAFKGNLTVQTLFFISILLSCFMLYSILTKDRLHLINGLTPEKNQSISEKISENLNWKNSKRNRNYNVFSPKWSWFSTHYGREVTVIYESKKVLINSTTFLLFDLQSPFHWFADRNTERKFKTEFEKEVKKTTRQHPL